MTIIEFSNTSTTLGDVLDRVFQDADVVVITRRNAPDAVAMSLDHTNSLLETLHLLSSPANSAHLTRSPSQLHAAQDRPRRRVTR